LLWAIALGQHLRCHAKLAADAAQGIAAAYFIGTCTAAAAHAGAGAIESQPLPRVDVVGRTDVVETGQRRHIVAGVEGDGVEGIAPLHHIAAALDRGAELSAALASRNGRDELIITYPIHRSCIFTGGAGKQQP